MKALPIKPISALAGIGLLITLSACSTDPAGEKSPSPKETAQAFTTRDVTDGTTSFVVVENPNGGETLSYTKDGKISLLEVQDGNFTYAFKDMNLNGKLDVWEDWREDPKVRAAALAQELSIEQIHGLMLYGAPASEGEFTDEQKERLADLHLRSGVTRAADDPANTVPWNNSAQAFIETLVEEGKPYVPLSISSDPRSGAAEYSGYVTSSRGISAWPSTLGLAATFNADIVNQFAKITAEEYRALGISAALHPQVDLATEPRWLRVQATVGENAADAATYAKALVDGFQGTFHNGELDAVGGDVVATFVKHVPGDGAGEGGRESHSNVGKFEVFPGGNFDEHASVFKSAKHALGMMTNYSIMVDGEGNPVLGGDSLVGTAYSPEIMDYIRNEIGFEGAIVTDWGVTGRTGWGTEHMEDAERFFELLKASIDLFGGSSAYENVEAAYDLWTAAHTAGEVDVDADTRWRESAQRILMFHFVPGIFENPFVDLEVAKTIVASEDRVATAYDAQLKSVVLAKNDGAISASTAADWADKTVYIPHSFDKGHAGRGEPVTVDYSTFDLEVAEQFFGKVVTDTVEYDADGVITSITPPADIADVDIVLVGMRSPNNGHPFTNAGQDSETGEWWPLSLQWRPYTADGDNVRKVSISGNILEDGSKENRSYFGNTSRISNEAELDAFERAAALIEASGKDIPLIAAVKANNPVVPAEFEAKANAVLIGFGVSDNALIEMALGLHEPQGRLPMAFPASMDAVEKQLEDVADTEPYVDSVGNKWSYGYGLNFSGKIK